MSVPILSFSKSVPFILLCYVRCLALRLPVFTLILFLRDLADMDVFSKSDPFIVVYTCSEGSNTWTEFKRTEVIYDNLNPDFATKLVMNYRFEEQQRLR